MINNNYNKIAIINPGWSIKISSTEFRKECTINLNHSIGFEYNKIFINLQFISGNNISIILSNIINVAHIEIYNAKNTSTTKGMLDNISCSKTSLVFTCINTNDLDITLSVDEIIYME